MFGKPLNLLSYKSYCASVIQRWWRRLHRFPSPTKGPYTPPPTTYTYTSQMGEDRDTVSTRQSDRGKRHITDPFEAAIVIQRAWRRHIVSQCCAVCMSEAMVSVCCYHLPRVHEKKEIWLLYYARLSGSYDSNERCFLPFSCS